MARRNRYYMLVASLPPLTSFERLERLPISSERLRDRLRMLGPEDAAAVRDAAAVFSWQEQPAERTDAGVIADYERLMGRVRHRLLRDLLEFAAGQRTIMAALRRRHLGMKPRKGETWGIGPLVPHIERHWDVADFALGAYLPWIPEADRLLRSGEALELDRLLTNVNWRWVTRRAQGAYFRFDAVAAYLAKWGMARTWLSYDSKEAEARFEELVKGTLNENQ